MSRKRKNKNRNQMKKVAPEESRIEIREVELGGVAEENTEEDVVENEDAASEMKEGASDEEAAEEPEEDSDAKASEEKTPEEGVVKGGWLHKLNIYYPWLKFVVAIALVAGLVFGGVQLGGMMDAQQGGESEKIADGDSEEGQTEAPEEGSGEKEAEEKPEEEEKPVEEPQEETATKPGATTNPPVEVPATGGKKLVALTFDDGPSTLTTGRLLDILKAKGVKATFFVVGSMVDKAPDLLKREISEGHEVGSHSSFHQDLSKLGAADLQADVANMDRIFTEVLGRKVGIVRPPYGAVSDIMRGYLGKPMIYWSVDPLDWKYRDAATVRANVVGATFDGAVVLMHDIHASTVDAVAGIIDDLRAQGYEFLTVSELAAARGIGLTSGVVYYSFKP